MLSSLLVYSRRISVASDTFFLLKMRPPTTSTRTCTLFTYTTLFRSLEGFIQPDDSALEGPFGDHTGYYNAQDHFPAFTIERMHLRREAIYHGSYMEIGRAHV